MRKLTWDEVRSVVTHAGRISVGAAPASPGFRGVYIAFATVQGGNVELTQDKMFAWYGLERRGRGTWLCVT